MQRRGIVRFLMLMVLLIVKDWRLLHVLLLLKDGSLLHVLLLLLLLVKDWRMSLLQILWRRRWQNGLLRRRCVAVVAVVVVVTDAVKRLIR